MDIIYIYSTLIVQMTYFENESTIYILIVHSREINIIFYLTFLSFVYSAAYFYKYILNFLQQFL